MNVAAPFPVFDGDQAGAEWGAALATVDVDGDGADELVLGAPLYDASESDEGLVVLEPGHRPALALTQTGPTLTIESWISASGDFDGDGFDDLLISAGSGMTQQLEVRYGSPAGLPAARDAQLPRPNFPGFDRLTIGLATGDFDGDGFGDAFVSFLPEVWGGHGGSGVSGEQHWLYPGSSSGLSSSPILIATNWGTATHTGDVNGDGRDDLVLRRSSSVEVYLGKAGSGLDAVPDQVFAGSANPVLAGNLNGDGFGDVVVAFDGGARVALLFGSPAGLVLQLTQTNLGLYSGFDFLADVNGDGLDDLLLRVFVNGAGYRHRAYLGSPAGFTRAEEWWEDPTPTGTSNAFINNPIKAVFDANHDGRADVLISGNRLHLGSPQGLQRSPGWWGPSELFPNYTGYFYGATGDFDGDGRLDLLVQDSAYTSSWSVNEFGEL